MKTNIHLRHQALHVPSGLLVCLLLLGLCSCDEKSKEASQPAPVPAEKKLATTPDPQEHLHWPVEVMIDKKRMAIPPQANNTRTLRQSQHGLMAWLKSSPIGGLLPESGRYIQSGGGAVRQPFKHILRDPKAVGKKGGVSKHQVTQDGGRTEIDADAGKVHYWNKDGTTSTWDGRKRTFTYADIEGSRTIWDVTNGGSVTYDNEGATIDHNADGSVDITNEDGSGAHLNGPGADDGSIGYTFGPGGPDAGTTTQFDDGDSIELPPPTYSDPPPESADPTENLGTTDGGLPFDGAGDAGSDKLASGSGDPHYLTRDGTGYSSQAVGEFVLATGTKGRQMQARHQRWNDSNYVSSITAIAFLVGETPIEVRLDGTVLMDGRAAPNHPMTQGEIPGGGVLGVWRSDSKLVSVVVVWPDISVAWVSVNKTWLDFHLQWRSAAPEQRGLLGSNDDDAANDLTDRNGKVASATNDTEVAAFVNSWRVTSEESLFTYGPNETTATYTDLDFPKDNAPTAHTALAEECCGSLPAGFAKEKCLYDVSVTGDRSFAPAYQNLYLRHQGALLHATRASMAAKARATKRGPALLTEAERKSAAKVELGAAFNETLKAGESKVFTFEFDDPNSTKLGLLSNQLAPGAKYSPDAAAYALFDKDGKLIGEMKPATVDFPMTELEKGTHYLKIMGPGLVDMKLH
jgi:hypothetical protein